MSDMKKKIDNFYTEAIGAYGDFQKEVADTKKKNNAKYNKVKDETVLLEDVFNEAVYGMDEYAEKLYGTPKRKVKKEEEPVVVKKKKIITEDAQSDLFGNDEPEEFNSEEKEIDQATDTDDMDEMDKADEILETIDLSALDNATRLELIRSIIDSAQNSSIDMTDGEEADEESIMDFDEFVEEVKNVIEEFQYEEEPESDEIGDDEDFNFDDEGSEEKSEEGESDDVEFEDEGDEPESDEEGEDDDFNFDDEEESDESDEKPEEEEEEEDKK